VVVTDADGDGYVSIDYGGNDCNDIPGQGENIHPNASTNCWDCEHTTPPINSDLNCNNQDDWYDCCPTSPLILNLDTKELTLTSQAAGVDFDFLGREPAHAIRAGGSVADE